MSHGLHFFLFSPIYKIDASTVPMWLDVVPVAQRPKPEAKSRIHSGPETGEKGAKVWTENDLENLPKGTATRKKAVDALRQRRLRSGQKALIANLGEDLEAYVFLSIFVFNFHSLHCRFEGHKIQGERASKDEPKEYSK